MDLRPIEVDTEVRSKFGEVVSANFALSIALPEFSEEFSCEIPSHCKEKELYCIASKVANGELELSKGSCLNSVSSKNN